MAEKASKDGRVLADVSNANTTDDSHHLDAVDEFDPFSSLVECTNEYIDVELVAPPEKEWYHGRLDRQKAEERLERAARVGGYLVRESDRKPGSYVLSFYGCTGINHFRITAMCGDYYIGGREFDKLSFLIGYYTSVSDLLKDERLQYPVAPPEPVYDDMRKVVAILPYTPMPETDELGFEKGDMFVVHNDLGDGWLWVKSCKNDQKQEPKMKMSGIVNQALVQELKDNVDPVIASDWYWSDITKPEARQILFQAGPGSWLVRPSDSSSGDHVLYFYHGRQIERFMIKREGKLYSMGGRHYETVGEITERYKQEQIVADCTLGLPVLRKKSSDSNLKATSNIYENMQQSSGSNFFLNRKDHIVIKGYLNKKSKSSKKWKKMYFILNETEMQLYYFENLKRSKPKGLIDLAYSYLYPVNDSFFDRPNCFQIISRGLNQMHVTEVVYICADSTDTAQEWLQHLKRLCENTREAPTRQSYLPRPTELRSVHLKVCDARKLPPKLVSHPYCVVSLNDVKVCRTPVKEMVECSACWDEQFIIDDIPPDIDSITVSVYNSYNSNKVRRKDVEVLSVRMSLQDLTPGEDCDKWHNLIPVNSTTKGEPSSLRVNCKYLYEVIMPLDEYKSLKELLCSDPELTAVFALAHTCSGTLPVRRALATSLLQIFRYEKQEAVLLRSINDHEINNEESPSQLFRASSMATAIMDQYMKMTSSQFVHEALLTPILKIIESKQSCEVVTTSPENVDVDANAKHLLQLLSDTVEVIFKSAHACPIVLRYICGCLQQKAQQRWPNERLVQTRVVSGFIFLRLLCPAILNPKQFNLIAEVPSATALRHLKLVANCLIKLANLSEAKDTQLDIVLTPFKQKYQLRLIQFLDELSDVQEVGDQPKPPNIDLARALATIHHICSNHQQKLLEAPFDNMKTLSVVTEQLTKHKKTYMNK